MKLAIEQAVENGWTVRPSGKSGHAWGRLLCPFHQKCRGGHYCNKSVWSTPKNPENHAKDLHRIIDGCPGLPETETEIESDEEEEQDNGGV